MGAEERLGRRRSIRLILFKLKSGEQQCLKAKHGAIKHGRRDSAKGKHNERKAGKSPRTEHWSVTCS